MLDFSLQFELWGQCNNFCDFCYLSSEYLNTSDKTKIENISSAKNNLKLYFKDHSEKIKAVGLIGGEFFQGQLNSKVVKDSFFDLCKQIFWYIEQDKVKDFWCYCTLTIGDQKDLYELIDLFDKSITNKEEHRFWIQVSYDTIGRFNQPGKFENWDKHMLNLQKYPFININVTSIMTEDLLNKILFDKIDLYEFQHRYNNTFFFKPPYKSGKDEINTKEKLNKKIPNFFPKRKTFISFLRFIKKKYPDIFNNILNIRLRADYLFNLDGDNILKHPLVRNKDNWNETAMDEEINLNCPYHHVTNYQCYCDSDACCLCDYLKIKDEID